MELACVSSRVGGEGKQVGGSKGAKRSQLRNYVGESMGVLRQAAQALVDRWDTPAWKDAPHTGQYIDALRAALAQPEQEPQWDEVFDAAVRAYARSAPSREALRLCFQNKSGRDQISIGWTAQELMAFAKDIASLYTNPPQRKPLTEEHLTALCRQHWNRQSNILDHLTFARAIERAHGIGGEE